MSEATSPRLPGVPLLLPHSTGPEYSRWRRSIKFALQTRDLWRYCNGKCPMPMPEAGPNAFPPSASTTNLQPSLLEERRAWVRQDREVKLDIFLSLTEEVMQEVFEVGPPLPPSNLNAQGMVEALDKHYAVFKFEAYHHAFCHFLNLHVDQFASIQEFNQEFSAVLEDLVDHGQPLSNMQACSAYFSKLRCTQNPWVAKKLEDWDSQPEDAGIMDLIKESPAWAVIRPLNTKTSQNFHVESIPEEHLEDTDGQESDSVYESTTGSTVSSIVSHSRQPSLESVRQTKTPPNDLAQKHLSTGTAQSLEITVHASTDEITEIDPQAFRKAEQLPLFVIPERGSSKHQTSYGFGEEGDAPEWLSARKSIARRPPPPPHNRPLPPLPAHALPAKQDDPRPRSASPRVPVNTGEDMPKPNLVSNQSADKVTTRLAGSRPPPLRLETTHPTLRPFAPARTPLGFRTTTPAQLLTADLPLHPALRPQTASPAPSTRPATAEPDVPVPAHKRSKSSESVAIPWPSTPDVAERPHTSRAVLGSPPEQDSADEPVDEIIEQAKRVVSQLPSPPMVRTEVPTTPFLDSTLQRWVYSPASMSCPSLPYSPSLYGADETRISTISHHTTTASPTAPTAATPDSPTLSTTPGPSAPTRLSTGSAAAPELAPHSPEPPIPAAIEYDANPPLQLQLSRTQSTCSDLSLPLQGTPTTPTSTASADAWTYLYEAKGGYLLPATATPRVPTPSPPMHQVPFRRTPMVEDAVVSLSTALHHRSGDAAAAAADTRDGGRLAQRLKASSLDLVARLSGDSVFETCESARERERRERKRRGWSMGVVGLARGVKGRGIKEII